MWINNVFKYVVTQNRIINLRATTLRQISQSSIVLNKENEEEDVDLLLGLGRENYQTEPKINTLRKPRFRNSPSELIRTNVLDIGKKYKLGADDTGKAIRKKKDTKIGKERGDNKTNLSDENEDFIAGEHKGERVKKDRKEKTNWKDELSKYEIHDEKLGLTFYKLPYEHPMLNNLIMMSRSKKYRDKKHLLVIEGRRLIEDALQAGLQAEYLFFSKHEQLEKVSAALSSYNAKPKIFRVPHNELTFWSVLQTCPGVIGIFNKPHDMAQIWCRNSTLSKQNEESAEENSEKDKISSEIKITIVCDQIREPSNIGSLIRTCAALPCTEIILLKGCADPWETKALRGGAGGQFRVPIRGPMSWESFRSILPKTDSYTVFIAENKQDNDKDDIDTKPKFSPVLYSDIPYNLCEHIILIIGGETEGVGKEAYEFLKSQKTSEASAISEAPKHQCIRIPLANGVESLNVNAATAILLFEIRKKLEKAKVV